MYNGKGTYLVKPWLQATFLHNYAEMLPWAPEEF